MNRALQAVMAVVLGGLMATCYAPSFADCQLRCSSAGTCPGNQSCDGTFCRGPGVTGICDAINAPTGNEGPPGDRDGDTILDDADNCPDVRNLEQDNEDGDLLGNVCDPCPPFGPPGNLDSDGDGVGDVCDPNPTAPGDSIAVFEGFERGVATPGALVPGGVTFVNGRMVFPNTGGLLQVLWAGATGQNRAVGTRFTIDAIAPMMNGVGVIDRFSPSATTGVACMVGISMLGGGQFFFLEAPTTERNNVAISVPTGQDTSLSLRRTANTYVCGHAPTNTAGNYVSVTNSAVNPPVVYAGLRAYAVARASTGSWSFTAPPPRTDADTARVWLALARRVG